MPKPFNTNRKQCQNSWMPLSQFPFFPVCSLFCHNLNISKLIERFFPPSFHPFHALFPFLSLFRLRGLLLRPLHCTHPRVFPFSNFWYLFPYPPVSSSLCLPFISLSRQKQSKENFHVLLLTCFSPYMLSSFCSHNYSLPQKKHLVILCISYIKRKKALLLSYTFFHIKYLIHPLTLLAPPQNTFSKMQNLPTYHDCPC